MINKYESEDLLMNSRLAIENDDPLQTAMRPD